MSPWTRGLLRVLLFIGVPAVGAVAPLVVLPALTRELGESGWASLAVGQSAGLFGAVIVNWGWSVEGPSLVARAPRPDRAALYASSARSRSLTAVFAVPIVAVIASAVAPAFPASAAVIAVATCLTGALPSWYFVGTGSPVLLACFDGLPRLAAAVGAAIVLGTVRSEWVYPIALLGVTLTALLLSNASITGSAVHRPGRPDWAHVRQRLLLVVSGLISSGYTTLAVPLVGAISPAAVSPFAAVMRFQGFAALALGATTSAAQGWVSGHGVSEAVLARRRCRALLGNTSAGVIAGGVLASALPAVTDLLFSGTVTLPASAGPLVGGIVVMLAVSMSTTFHLLVPTGRTRTVAISGIVTSSIGVPLLIVLVALWGPAGGLVAILIAETVSASLQLLAYFGRPRLVR